MLGLGFLLSVSLVVSAALAALGKWWGVWFEGWNVLLEIFNFVVSFGMFTLLFAMIYKIMLRAKIPWRDVWTGAAVTALLFAIGKVLIGLYLGKSSLPSGFGAAGSLVVLIAWVYYSAQIFLFGAEYTLGQRQPAWIARAAASAGRGARGAEPQRRVTTSRRILHALSTARSYRGIYLRMLSSSNPASDTQAAAWMSPTVNRT